MFPEVPFFLPRLQNVYELPFFFQPRCLGINQMTQESFFSLEMKPEQSFQHDAFLDFLVFLWTFWPLFRINDT